MDIEFKVGGIPTVIKVDQIIMRKELFTRLQELVAFNPPRTLPELLESVLGIRLLFALDDIPQNQVILRDDDAIVAVVKLR
jgi:hypothetical protein